MSDVLQWASPERRRMDDSPLPFVANEIYLEIFDYIVPSPRGLSELDCHVIFRNLALVCRFFYVVSVPRIFETVTFILKKVDTNTKSQRARSDWCREVCNNRQPALSLAAYVKTCRLSDWHTSPEFYSGTLEQPDSEYPPQFIAVSRFQNLESLSLYSIPITQQFFLSVIAKDSLKSVSISTCTFQPLQREWDLEYFQPRWSKIYIRTFCTNRKLYDVPLSILASSPNLQSCDIDDDDLTNAIFSRPVQFDNLHDLRVSRPTTLENFIDRTPSIVKLHWVSSQYPVVSRKCLPGIREISCYYGIDRILQELITRPSLEKIELSPSVQEGPMVWELLQHAGSGVKGLFVPNYLYTFCPLSTKFPVLDELEITFFYGQARSETSLVLQVCEKWRNHPQVRLLSLGFVPFRPWLNLQDQYHALVGIISGAFSRTKTVHFLPYFEWQRSDSRWKVDIIDRPQLLYHLEHLVEHQHVWDFEGTLVNLYDEGEGKNVALRSHLKSHDFIPAA